MGIKTNANQLKKTSHPYGIAMLLIKGISFTKRETDVLACLTSGRSLKGISFFLNIHYKTLEVYMANIRKKLGYSTRDHIVDVLENSPERGFLNHRYEQIQQSKRFQEIVRTAKLSRSFLKKGFIIFYTPQTKEVAHQLQKQLDLLPCSITLEPWSQDRASTYPHLVLTHEADPKENRVMIEEAGLTVNRFYAYILSILQNHMTVEKKAMAFFKSTFLPIPMVTLKKNTLWKRGGFWALIFFIGLESAVLYHFNNMVSFCFRLPQL